MTPFTFQSADPTVAQKLFAPVKDVLIHYTRSSRDCPKLSDEHFLWLGIQRTLSQSTSGRDFLQQQREVHDDRVSLNGFFESLHSQRRLQVTTEVANQFCYLAPRLLSDLDYLSVFPELAQRDVWAVDGHKIAHACHSLRDTKGRHVPPNSLYLLSLHNGLFSSIAPVQGHGVYGHEMPVFRRASAAWLRRHQRGCQRPVFVTDPAYIDNKFWDRLAQTRQAGAVVITRLKKNMKPSDAQQRPFDASDQVNCGVEADLEVFFGPDLRMRLVLYRDPETGEYYEFLTTDFDLRPGVIAWLYYLRWRIEKVFDTAKNKLQEQKGWANGSVAQQIQDHFLAITHNALVLLRHLLKAEHGIEEDKMKAKRAAALKRRHTKAAKAGRRLHPLSWQAPAIVQLTLQYIRAVRNFLLKKAHWSSVLDEMRAMLVAYL